MTYPRKTYAVDLDKTLARYDGWPEDNGIGEPLEQMVNRVRGWRLAGHAVWIFTARVCPIRTKPVDAGSPEDLDAFIADQEAKIKTWCLEHLGEELPVTSQKLPIFDEIWDDRARHVLPNTGCLIPQHFSLEIGHYEPEAQEMIHSLLAANQEVNRMLQHKTDELMATQDAAMLQESRLMALERENSGLRQSHIATQAKLNQLDRVQNLLAFMDEDQIQRLLSLTRIPESTLRLAEANFRLKETIRDSVGDLRGAWEFFQERMAALEEKVNKEPELEEANVPVRDC